MEIRQIKIKNTWTSVCAFYNHPDVKKGICIWLGVLLGVDLILILVKYLELMDIYEVLVALNDYRFFMINILGPSAVPFFFILSLFIHTLKFNSAIIIGEFELVLKRQGILYLLLKNTKIPYRKFISISVIKNRYTVIRYSGGIFEKQISLIGYDQNDREILKLLEEKSGVKAKIYNSFNDIGAGKFITFE